MVQPYWATTAEAQNLGVTEACYHASRTTGTGIISVTQSSLQLILKSVLLAITACYEREDDYVIFICNACRCSGVLSK